MMMRILQKKGWIVIIAALLAIVGCSDKDAKEDGHLGKNTDNVHKTGMPIVEDDISFEIFTPSNPNDADWDDMLVWAEYKDMTNIDIEWLEIAEESLDERRNLAIGGEDLPDAFYAARFPPMDLLKYGERGVFNALNDLTDEYAPNLKKLMDEDPDTRESVTIPNGDIYAFPGVTDPDFLSMHIGARPWFNEKWLDELDMEVPETTDEFYAYLKAVKETDLIGDGSGDEIPYGANDIKGLIDWLSGAYGLSKQNDDFIDLDPEGDGLRFVPTSDRYKEMLQFVNKLYNEELISQNIFSVNDETFHANGGQGLYGSTVWFDPAESFGPAGEAYTGGTALEGPYGDRFFSKCNLIGRIDGLVITNENENPEAMTRWIDYFYSDEGARLQYMGVEGESYEETADGEFEY